MKKNILKVAIVAMFGLFAGYNVYTSQAKDVLLSGLVLNNVEALANDSEASGDTCDTYCTSDEKVTCVINYLDGTSVTCNEMKAK